MKMLKIIHDVSVNVVETKKLNVAPWTRDSCLMTFARNHENDREQYIFFIVCGEIKS